MFSTARPRWINGVNSETIQQSLNGDCGRRFGLGNSGVKFRRQQGIGPYIADFYCPGRLLVIEVDGDSHFDMQGLRHDKRRDAYMAALSLTVLRFSNREVMENLPGVVVSIRAWLDRV